MTIELMSVIGADADNLLVSIRDRAHCDHCAVSSGCGLQLLNKTFIQRQETLSLLLPLAYAGKIEPGDQLKVSIDDVRLIYLALLQYFFPVASMVVVTAIAEAMGVGEPWVIFSALGALLGSLAGVRFLSTALFSNKTGLTAAELLKVQI